MSDIKNANCYPTIGNEYSVTFFLCVHIYVCVYVCGMCDRETETERVRERRRGRERDDYSTIETQNRLFYLFFIRNC